MVTIKGNRWTGKGIATRNAHPRTGLACFGPFFLVVLALLLWPLLSIKFWPARSRDGLPHSSREDTAGTSEEMARTVQSLRKRLGELETAQMKIIADAGGTLTATGNKRDTTPKGGFRLFQDFSIARMIEGDEGWEDLLEYRRILRRPSLSFYVDKVAVKRWLPSQGIDIPRPILVRYRDEFRSDLPASGIPQDYRIVQSMMPEQPDSFDYAAKPSHTSSSYGVRVAKHGVAPVGYGWGYTTKMGRNELEDVGSEDEDVTMIIAARLFEYLRFRPSALHSWALRNIKQPGVVVEERFALWDDDNMPPMEFKILTIWGRVHVAEWWRGNDHLGRVYRNGTLVVEVDEKEDGDEKESTEDEPTSALPDIFDWRRVVEIAEQMGSNKDLFRTDVFVGVAADSSVMRPKATKEERRSALRIVVSEFELHPSISEVTDHPTYEEAARLWLAGYKTRSFHLVPNTEVPPRYLATGILPQPHESKEWKATKFTQNSYVIAGVNLAEYRMPVRRTGKDAGLDDQKMKDSQVPYELFEEFNIADKITGNEGWWDLIALRIGLENLSCFYNDKIAVKRYLPSIGLAIPTPLALKYKSELTQSRELKDETEAIVKLLPKKKSYVAKPSHSCLGQGVWRVTYKAGNDDNNEGGNILVAKKNDIFEYFEEDYDPRPIAGRLAEYLHLDPGTYGSYLYDHIQPGIVVEERLTAWDDEDVPATEFKVFCIWGRVYVAKWRIGLDHHGLVYQNGTIVNLSTDDEKTKLIPDDAKWPKVVEIAEQMAAHKDMFRTDIFVGVPAGSPSHRAGATKKEKKAAIQVVVNEFEMQPGMSHMFNAVFEEAARLWIAGYKTLNLRLVPNTEVPKTFKTTGALPESPTPALQTRSSTAPRLGT